MNETEQMLAQRLSRLDLGYGHFKTAWDQLQNAVGYGNETSQLVERLRAESEAGCVALHVLAAICGNKTYDLYDLLGRAGVLAQKLYKLAPPAQDGEAEVSSTSTESTPPDLAQKRHLAAVKAAKTRKARKAAAKAAATRKARKAA